MQVLNSFLEKINKIHIKIILMPVIPLLIFDIVKDFEYSEISKYGALITLLISPLFKTITEPKIKELKDNIKTKRNKQKNDRKNKRDN